MDLEPGKPYYLYVSKGYSNSQPIPFLSCDFEPIFLCGEVAACMLFGSHAHMLGHVETNSRVVHFLRRCRLLISPAYHKVHHCGRHDVRYCVINGWANPICDRR